MTTNKPEDIKLQIEFVDRAGAKQEGPLIVVPNSQLQTHFDEGSWDRSRSIREFRAHVLARNSLGMEAAMRATDRHGCWHVALEQFFDERAHDAIVGESLLWLWITYGFHVANSLKGDRILIDVFRHLLPPYTGEGRPLYRGELDSRHQENLYGISWTRDLSVARMFAQRRLAGEGLGVIVKIVASPQMIVAAPNGHSEYLQENEYIVDTRLIRHVEVIP